MNVLTFTLVSPLMAKVSGYSDFVFGNRAWLGTAIAAALVFMLLSFASYRQSRLSWWMRVLGVLLRSIGIGLLLFCLLEPMATLERPKPQANSFAILVDRSKSMDVLNQQRAQQGAPTLNSVLDDSSPWLSKLTDDFRVRRFLFDSSLEPIDTFEKTEYSGNDSALYNSLNSLKDRFHGKPLAGVLLLTDGQATDRVPEDLAAEYGFPVYPVRLGNLSAPRDVRIDSVTISQSEFETSPCTAKVKVAHQGFSGDSIRVDLIDTSGKVLESQTITMKQDDTPMLAEFRFRPEKSGVQGYRIVARRDSELATADATPGDGVPKSKEFQARAESTSELTLGNNSRFLVVDRGRGPYRILYVAGRPNWEYKFLKRALDEDDEIRITSLIRIAKKEIKFDFRDSAVDQSNPLFSGFEDVIPEEKEQYDETVFARLGLTSANELKKGLPKDATELFEYSAIIMDDLEHEFFSADQQSMLRQFVATRGGGLLVLGGEESIGGRGFRDSVLGQMLPVYGEESSSDSETNKNQELEFEDSPSVRYTLTREGWLLPFLRTEDSESSEKVRLATMPSFEVLNRTRGVKPGASVLAEAVDSTDSKTPALVTQRFGKGRTAALLIGDMWRWGLHNQKNTQSPLYQSWRQMVRWLIADVPKRIQMKIDESNQSNQSVRVLVDVAGPDFRSLDNAIVSTTIVSPSGKETLAPAEAFSKISGQYELSLVANEKGVYSMTATATAADGSLLGTSQLGWIHDPDSVEFQQLGENTSALDRLAKETGGEVIALEQLESFVQSLESRKVPVTETKTEPLWHQGWIILISLACICGEWGLRRRYGLA
jgi:hypothetical protein